MRAEDRRRHPRIDVNIRVRIQYNDTSVTLNTGNISRYGFLLITDTPLGMGEQLSFTLTVPDSDYSISGRGQVMWRQVPKEAGDEGSMGIKFVEMTPEDTEFWAKYVETIRLSYLTEELLDAGDEPRAVSPQQGEATAAWVLPVRDINEMRRLYNSVSARESMRVRIGKTIEPAEDIRLVFHHPWTGSEYALRCTAADPGDTELSSGESMVRVTDFDETEKMQLFLFAETGFVVPCDIKKPVTLAVIEELSRVERRIRRDPLDGPGHLTAALMANFLGRIEIAKDYLEGAKTLKQQIHAEIWTVLPEQ